MKSKRSPRNSTRLFSPTCFCRFSVHRNRIFYKGVKAVDKIRKIALFLALSLMAGAVYLFYSAVDLLKQYEWALTIRFPPKEFYDAVIYPIVFQYQTRFIPYLVLGVISLATGLAIIITISRAESQHKQQPKKLARNKATAT